MSVLDIRVWENEIQCHTIMSYFLRVIYCTISYHVHIFFFTFFLFSPYFSSFFMKRYRVYAIKTECYLYEFYVLKTYYDCHSIHKEKANIILYMWNSLYLRHTPLNNTKSITTAMTYTNRFSITRCMGICSNSMTNTICRHRVSLPSCSRTFT